MNAFDAAAEKFDTLTKELEKELAADISSNIKESYMTTMIKNVNQSIREEEQAKVIPLGPFKGVSSKEATQRVMEKNAVMPTALLMNESREAKSKLSAYQRRKEQLVAEFEVKVESITAVYDSRIDNNTNIIKELLDQIKTIENRIGELTTLNSKHMEDKGNRLADESIKHEKELENIEQIIQSMSSLIENLAKPIN